jgi:hypothetical protein
VSRDERRKKREPTEVTLRRKRKKRVEETVMRGRKKEQSQERKEEESAINASTSPSPPLTSLPSFACVPRTQTAGRHLHTVGLNPL